ncbi:MAG TPA: hypothetical protein VIU43_05720 [Nitrosospira sp.]
MAGIILPVPLRRQPQYNASIDSAGLGKGAQILFNPALGPVDLVTGRVWSPGGNASVAVGQQGRVFNLDGVDDFYAYTGYPELTSNIGTFFIWCTRVGGPDTHGHVLFGASSPNISGHQVFPNLAVSIGSNSASTGVLSSWFNTTNRSLVLVSGGTAARCKAYVDGVDAGLTWSTDPVAWGAGNKNFNLGRYVGGTLWDTDASVLSAGITGAVWGAAEARAFHENPWKLFKSPTRRLWAVASSVADLSGTDSLVANAASASAISQDHALAGANSLQMAIAGIGTMLQAHALAGASSLQSTTGSIGAILQNHVLAGPKSAQTNSGSNPAISQTHVITGANSSQANAGNAGAISGGSGLIGAPGNQANASSTRAVAQAHALIITASAQVNPSSAVAITQIRILRGANPVQSNSAGAGAISLSTGNLAAVSSTQINLAGAGAISQAGVVIDLWSSSPAVSSVIRKPGIPAGTPAWLKIFLEIIAGRRGNRIAVPPRQNLTFSAIPTKAECEALYSYVNDVRGSLDALVNRLDS